MELTSMLLTQLTGKNSSGNNNLNSSNNDFNKYLSKETRKETKQSDKISKSNNEKKKETNKNFDKYDKALEKNNNKKIDDKKQIKEEIKKPDEKSMEKLEGNNAEKTENTIVIDENTLEEISKILNMSQEDIINVLASLSMSVSMLEQPENLILFIQKSFDLEDNIGLLSMDNVKDILRDISEVAKNIDYKDVYTNDNIEETINSLKEENLENFTLLNNNSENFTEKIENLLQEMNGKIVSIKNFNSSEKQLTKEMNVEQINTQATEENGENLEYYQQNENNAKNSNSNTNGNNQNSSLFIRGNEANEFDLNNLKTEGINLSEITTNSKVFNSSLPKTQALKNINSTEVVNQIIEKMKISIKPDISEMKILLRPDHLGEVALKIATQNGIVTAQFVAESQKVKEIIESNFSQLKDVLMEQGINVGQLEVNVSDGGKEESNLFEQDNSKSEARVKNIIKDAFKEENLQEEKNTSKESVDSIINYSV